jgi:hypothetical protein
VILRDVPCKRSEVGREQEAKREAPPPAARAPEAHTQPKQVQKLNEALVKSLRRTSTPLLRNATSSRCWGC